MDATKRFPIAQVVAKVFQHRDWNRNDVLDLPGATTQAQGARGVPNEAALRIRDRVMLSTARALGYPVPPGLDPTALAAAADFDGDARVTREELAGALRKLDADRDGHLDHRELAGACELARRGALLATIRAR